MHQRGIWVSLAAPHWLLFTGSSSVKLSLLFLISGSPLALPHYPIFRRFSQQSLVSSQKTRQISLCWWPDLLHSLYCRGSVFLFQTSFSHQEVATTFTANNKLLGRCISGKNTCFRTTIQIPRSLIKKLDMFPHVCKQDCWRLERGGHWDLLATSVALGSWNTFCQCLKNNAIKQGTRHLPLASLCTGRHAHVCVYSIRTLYIHAHTRNGGRAMRR